LQGGARGRLADPSRAPQRLPLAFQRSGVGRLIAGVDAGTIVPDAETRRLVRELAEASDREEEYERVVFEHDALAALREQIGAGR
jgi:hypothetical protein